MPWPNDTLYPIWLFCLLLWPSPVVAQGPFYYCISHLVTWKISVNSRRTENAQRVSFYSSNDDHTRQLSGDTTIQKSVARPSSTNKFCLWTSAAAAKSVIDRLQEDSGQCFHIWSGNLFFFMSGHGKATKSSYPRLKFLCSYSGQDKLRQEETGRDDLHFISSWLADIMTCGSTVDNSDVWNPTAAEEYFFNQTLIRNEYPETTVESQNQFKYTIPRPLQNFLKIPLCGRF